LRLIGHDTLDGIEGDALEVVRGAGRAGRQLVTLARRMGLGPVAGTGVYQAVGREKIALSAATQAQIRGRGFDSFRPAAIVFEHFVHGPFISLAIALECDGPFQVLESHGLAGLTALYTAAYDLDTGRCARALVGAVDPPSACLLALAPGPPLRVIARWSRSDAVERSLPELDGTSLHGLPEIAAALAGGGLGFRAQTGDGRALATRFVRAGSAQGSHYARS
jgi:hypothetical protein